MRATTPLLHARCLTPIGRQGVPTGLDAARQLLSEPAAVQGRGPCCSQHHPRAPQPHQEPAARARPQLGGHGPVLPGRVRSLPRPLLRTQPTHGPHTLPRTHTDLLSFAPWPRKQAQRTLPQRGHSAPSPGPLPPAAAPSPRGQTQPSSFCGRRFTSRYAPQAARSALSPGTDSRLLVAHRPAPPPPHTSPTSLVPLVRAHIVGRAL